MVKLVVAFAPFAESGEERAVLCEDTGVDRACHATQRIDVARVHAGRMPIAVFGFLRKLDRLVDVRYRGYRQYRHHLLGPDKGVSICDAHDQQSRIAVGRDACAGKNFARILADQVFLECRPLPAPGILGEHHVGHFVQLALVQYACSVLAHVCQQLVHDTLDRDDFFFVDAHDVVVEGSAGDDVAGGVLEVGRRIDNDRRIAGPGANRTLAAGHCLAHDTAASGHSKEANALVPHEFLCGLNGRRCYCGNKIGRTSGTR